MLANLLAAQLYSAPVWPSAASQRMTSNRRDLRSAGCRWRHIVADRGWRAITSLSVSTELQNSVERTFTLYYEKSTHAKRWTQSTTNFSTVYGHVGKVVVKVVKSTQYRRSWTATATTDADVRCCRRRIDNRVAAFLWYRRRYCTTTRYRQLRPVADFTAQSSQPIVV